MGLDWRRRSSDAAHDCRRPDRSRRDLSTGRLRRASAASRRRRLRRFFPPSLARPAPLGRRHPRTMGAVGGEHIVKSSRIDPGLPLAVEPPGPSNPPRYASAQTFAMFTPDGVNAKSPPARVSTHSRQLYPGLKRWVVLAPDAACRTVWGP